MLSTIVTVSNANCSFVLSLREINLIQNLIKLSLLCYNTILYKISNNIYVLFQQVKDIISKFCENSRKGFNKFICFKKNIF